MGRQVQTASTLVLDRSFSPRMAGEAAKALEASGVVDYVLIYDQLTGFFPRAIWTPDITPLANVMKDPDSYSDAFVTAAFAIAATHKLGALVSHDSIRLGPAELMQTMLTLANATEGKAVLLLAAGEVKQCSPFGYKRSEGLDRMEDHLQIYRKILTSEGPFNHEGKIWHYHNAYIGDTRPYLPKVWAMGGGPRLIDLAGKYADGFATTVPMAFGSPEAYAAVVKKVKQDVERAGRDPEEFGFGIWVPALLHEDQEMLEGYYGMDIVKWVAAFCGRLKQSDWELEGVTPVFPKGWHYAQKLLPAEMPREEVMAIINRTPREMVVKGYICGSPKEAASDIQPYIEAGATHVSIQDFVPMALPFEEAQQCLARSIETCRILKNG